jgi:DtxR family Mn-dependent transcriptional regulator
MSDVVEDRILEILGHPTVSPFGNPIPGLPDSPTDDDQLLPLTHFGAEHAEWVTIRRIGETVHDDSALLERLAKARALPGDTVMVRASDGGGVMVGTAGEYAELDAGTASHVMVRPARQPQAPGA